MSDSSLWSFFLAATLSVAVAIVALGAALIINQRNRLLLQRRFSQRLLEAQDEERAWVAREVHDDALQQLAAVRNSFERLGQGVERPAIEQQLTDLATTLRSVAHRLHPALLQQSGVATALTQLATESRTKLNLEVTARIDPPTSEPPDAVGLAFYRVAQEALRNVAQHAGVTTATLSWHEYPDRWMLSIVDHGRGLAADRPTGRPSLGRISMRERAALVGGTLRIESGPGGGTAVTLSVPRTGHSA